MRFGARILIAFLLAILLICLNAPASVVAQDELVRRYYIATLTGTGTDNDPFRPVIADYSKSWGAIDLRPDRTKRDGYCIAYADTANPISIPQAILLSDKLSTKISTSNTLMIGNLFGVSLPSDTVPNILAKLLITETRNTKLCNPILPSFDGKYRIYLGGRIYGEPLPPLRSGTFTDDFNRANEDLGAPNWADLGGDWEVFNNKASNNVVNTVSLVRCLNTELTSLDHYSQLDIVTLNPTGAGGRTNLIGPAVRLSSDTTSWTDAKCYFTQALIEQTTTTLQIRLRTGGSTSTLATKSYTFSLPDTIKTEIDGSTLKAYVNSSEELSTSDSTLPGADTQSKYYWGGIVGFINTYHNPRDVEGDNYEMANLAGVSAPTVTTSAATNIESTTATGNGEITSTGGENASIRGFQWGTETGVYTTNVTEEGSFSTGVYDLSLTSLPAGTTIYYRAEAYNSGGWGYGSEQTFLTKPAAPTNVAAGDGSSTSNVTITWTKSTGATDYQVYRDGVALGWLGDVATFDDTDADAPTITAGDAVASDGSSTSNVSLSLSGASANNGTTHTYKVRAKNATGESADSSTDTGYCGVGALNYQWQKSAADSDADYSNIEGATSPTYEDTAAPAPTITAGSAVASDGTYYGYVALSISGASVNAGDGRHYQCLLTAEGATGNTSASDRGYRGVGSPTYQWQRSATDSDADYSNIDGATTATYNDTGAPENGDGRYYKCVINADGAAENTTAPDRGYRSPATTATITNDGATNVTDNNARLNGSVTDSGGDDPDITVFWGTSDGGESPAGWTDNASLGIKGVGSFYYDIMDNLSPETLYYFIFMAENDSGISWSASANFTTLESSYIIGAPTNFTLTDLGAITINMQFGKGENSTYTMIRVSRTDYPADVAAGELVFYGEEVSANTTGYALDLNNFFFTAWGFAADNVTHSSTYAQASIGGEGMTEIADSIGELTTEFSGLLPTLLANLTVVVIILFLCYLAWRHSDPMLYIVCGFALMIYGFSLWSAAWYLSMILVLVGIYCFVRAKYDRKKKSE